MRFIYSIFLFCALLLSSSMSAQTTLQGSVYDQETNDIVIGANIKIFRAGTLVKGAVTDFDGNFRVTLDSGYYDVEASFTGTRTKRITGVQVLNKTANFMDKIILGSVGHLLEEVIIESHKVPLIRKDDTSGGQTLTADQIKNLPTRNVNQIVVTTSATATTPASPGAAKSKHKSTVATTHDLNPTKRHDGPEPEKTGIKTAASEYPGTYAIDGSDVTIRGSRTDATNFYVDGIRVYGETTVPVREIEITGSRKDATAYYIDGLRVRGAETKRAQARLLTAGEWNELNNWTNHFTQVYADGECDIATKAWSIFPERRYSAMLSNKAGLPLANTPVYLVNKAGDVIWQAKTDQMGRAECWAAPFSATQEAEKLTWCVGAKKTAIGKAQPFKDSPQMLTADLPCAAATDVDILWMIDATSSMGDEIRYLQAEVQNVIGRVQANLPQARIRNGALFYRDFQEEYVVRSAPFTSNIEQINTFIDGQRASGGGDKPEAVDSALIEGMLRMDWNPNAVARICFLMLDASPHQSTQVNQNLQAAIKRAAEMGIRIVPTTASGITKDTEWLLKSLAMLTNGTYTFLTDHSGIGEKHLEPTAETYSVELLNDLLVRIITEYGTPADCNTQTDLLLTNNQQDSTQQAQNQPIAWSIFPNPATTQVQIAVPVGTQAIKIFDAEGKLVQAIESPKDSTLTVALKTYSPGAYLVQLVHEQGVSAARLIVVRM